MFPCLRSVTLASFSLRLRVRSEGVYYRTRFYCASIDRLHILNKGEVLPCSVAELYSKALPYARTHVDIGTGDGKFVYQQAKVRPDTFFIGIDLHPERMYHYSWKSGRKPSKGGGVENMTYICSSLEQLPSSLIEIANSISIHFPWAALLSAIVKPEPEMLKKISQLAKKKADLEITLNYSVFQDHAYAQTLGLPLIDSDYITTVLKPTFKAQKIDLRKFEFMKTAQCNTTWGQQLVLGGHRELLWLFARFLK